MINSEINYKFNQIETALIAFVSNLQLKLEKLIPDLPVFIQNTGDFSYYIDKKFVDTKNEEIYQKNPRFVIKIDDIQPNSQEDSNPYNKLYYTFDNGNEIRNYSAVIRRKSFNVNITTNFVSSNYIVALNHFELLATLLSRDNVFTYEFLGNTLQAAYVFQSNSSEIPSIDMGQNSNRSVVLTNQIELQLQLLIPRIETIILLDDTGTDETIIGLYENNNQTNIDKQNEHNFDVDNTIVEQRSDNYAYENNEFVLIKK